MAPPAAKVVVGGGTGGGGTGGGTRIGSSASFSSPQNGGFNGGSRGSQNSIINRSSKGAGQNQQDESPDGSGDFFDNLRASFDFSLSSFDDGFIGSKGHFDSRSFTLNSDISTDFTIGFEYNEQRFDYGRKASIRTSTVKGLTLSAQYRINENYGISGYGFYQKVDIENINGNSYSYGGGLIFTTYHETEYFNIITANSLSWVDFDYGEETVFLSVLELNRDITDWLNFGVNVSFADSFFERNSIGLDRTYWTGGADLRFNFDNIFFSIGYYKTFKLDQYDDNTLNFSFTYIF